MQISVLQKFFTIFELLVLVLHFAAQQFWFSPSALISALALYYLPNTKQQADKVIRLVERSV